MDFFGWKVLGCGCFDVWVVFGWFLLDFETPPPAFPAFSMLCSAILVNLWARGGVRGPWEGPCWFVLIEKLSGMALFDVWKCFELVSLHLRQLFFGQLLIAMYMYGDNEDFLGLLLGGSYLLDELDLELRQHSDLILFCLNGLLSYPDKMAQSFSLQSFSEKC